jgi:hypothetical protein
MSRPCHASCSMPRLTRACTRMVPCRLSLSPSNCDIVSGVWCESCDESSVKCITKHRKEREAGEESYVRSTGMKGEEVE